MRAPWPAPLPPLTAAPPSAPTAAPPSAPMPASLATSMYLSFPSRGVPPAVLAACRLQALMSSRVGVAGFAGSVTAGGEGVGVWATAGAAGVVDGAAAGGVAVLGDAEGDSTRASWVGAGARLATTRPVTTAETAAMATPIAVSFQRFARLDSFMMVLRLRPTAPIVPATFF